MLRTLADTHLANLSIHPWTIYQPCGQQNTCFVEENIIYIYIYSNIIYIWYTKREPLQHQHESKLKSQQRHGTFGHVLDRAGLTHTHVVTFCGFHAEEKRAISQSIEVHPLWIVTWSAECNRQNTLDRVEGFDGFKVHGRSLFSNLDGNVFSVYPVSDTPKSYLVR